MSKIEWTDKTWNPVTGCTKVSQGCKFCYAEVMAKRTFGRLYRPVLGDGSSRTIDVVPTSHHEDYLNVGLARPRRFTDVQCHPDRLDAPLRWRKPCRVFVNSMSDLFHEAVPDEFIDRVFAVMALCPRHTFQILTKRPERMRAYFAALDSARLEPVLSQFAYDVDGRSEGGLLQLADVIAEGWRHRGGWWPLPNVWLGTSTEDQPTADRRIPEVLATPAAVRFVSLEPMLGPVTLEGWPTGETPARHFARQWLAGATRLDWVIVGGESGPKARRCDVAWVRSVVAQCARAGVPCFVKQLGANVIDRNDAGFTGDFDGSGRAWPEQHAIDDRIEHDLDGTRDGYQGAPVRIHCRDPKGGDPSEWPEDLQVREFPEVRL